MSRLMPVATAVTLLVAYGLADGYWTDRWSLSRELADAPARLTEVPLRVGEWEGEERELDPRQARQGEIKGSILRRYANRATGEALSVLLVCGRPGPIAVHSPDVCLGGAGFELQREAARRPISGPGLSGEDAFWEGRFHKPAEAVPEVIDVYWSWNGGDGWKAVKSPRLFFARERVLYKLYVTRAVDRPDAAPAAASEGAAGETRDPSRQFLTVFLPEVSRALFSGQ
ncbi:MAG: exosortase-associated EpsI family protein [Gemmataceae bacterium]